MSQGKDWLDREATPALGCSGIDRDEEEEEDGEGEGAS